jgi:hypothetical protein
MQLVVLVPSAVSSNRAHGSLYPGFLLVEGTDYGR